ncbi:MAG: DnaB-like helicase C-terminal domain-containing protein [Candidatus Nezhaarchaeales archaeon]
MFDYASLWDVESQVLGSAVIDPDFRIKLLEKAESSWFENYQLRQIFDAIAEHERKGLPTSVSSVAASTGLTEEFVTEVIITADTGLAYEWLNELEKRVASRKLEVLVSEALSDVRRNDPDAASEKINAALATYSKDRVFKWKPIVDDDFLLYLETVDTPSVSTGIKSLDSTVGLWREGALYVLYGHSGSYKTWVAVNIAYLFARNGHGVAFFSTEMSANQIRHRLLSIHSRGANVVDDEFKSLKILIDDTTVLSTGQLASRSWNAVKYDGVQVVIIDLLDHVYSSSFSDLIAMQSHVTNFIKGLAKDLGVVVIATSHIRKQDEYNRYSPVIAMEELKGASSKYQDADVLVSLVPVAKRDGAWTGMTQQEIGETVRNKGRIPIMLYTTKNRYAPPSGIVLYIDTANGCSMAS